MATFALGLDFTDEIDSAERAIVLLTGGLLRSERAVGRLSLLLDRLPLRRNAQGTFSHRRNSDHSELQRALKNGVNYRSRARTVRVLVLRSRRNLVSSLKLKMFVGPGVVALTNWRTEY